MKWYDDKYSNSSSLILPSLYRVNEDIYDEITEISNNEYLYKKKCGIVKYTENHNYKNYVTNGEYIIYELPISEQSETIINNNGLLSFSDVNTTVLHGSKNVDFDFSLDRRYEESRVSYKGNIFGVSKENLDLDNRKIKVFEIIANRDNTSELKINDNTYPLPTILNKGDRLVWQDVNQSYIYYSYNVKDDVRYYPFECIEISKVPDNTLKTFNSEGAIIESTYEEKKGINEVSFTSINEKPIEKLVVEGNIKSVGKLPDGYEELDYISSNITGANGNPSDTPYIVTDYYPDVKKTNIEIKFKPLNKYPEYGCIYGAYEDFSTDCYMLIYRSDCIGFRVSGSTNNVDGKKFILGDTYTIKCGDGYLNIVDETNPANSFNTTLQTYNITGRISCPAVIGARRKGTNFENSKCPLMDLYYIKVFEETTLVHEYIPCTNPDGLIGVYDTVDKSFLMSNIHSSKKDYKAGNVIGYREYFGLGGQIGQPSVVTLNHTADSSTTELIANLSQPLLTGETIDFISGVVTRKFRVIDSYNGENVGDNWYSSIGALKNGASVAYEVEPYTENITSNAINTYYDKHTFTLHNDDMECGVSVKYDSTDYNAFCFKISYDNVSSYGMTNLSIYGSETGVGTKKDDGTYKLTLIIQDINNKKNKKSIDIDLDNILYKNDIYTLNADDLRKINFNIADNVYLYFEENIENFSLTYIELPNMASNNEILISVPYKTIRKLSSPTLSIDMGVGSGNGYGEFSWQEVYGATEYKIFIDDELFDTVDNKVEELNIYKFNSEVKGDIYLIANNDELQSSTDKISILSVPNSTVIKNVDIMYETNKYKISFNFDNNSNICDYYKLQYTVDGGNVNTIRIPNTYAYCENIEYSFTQTDISDNLTIWLLPTNSTGSNNYIDSQKYITIDDFSAWTYKTDLKQALLCWYDNLTNEDGYLLKYRINRGDWTILRLDSVNGVNNKMLEYIDMDDTSIMDACITAVIDGKPQVYTKSIRISKSLDTMLVPPVNFTGNRLEYGKLNFEWEDNGYTSKHSYQLQITDAVSGKVQNFIIDGNDVGKYCYEYLTDGYGYVTAKVKMVWELGESEYTQNVIVYNINVVYDAPPMNKQEHIDNKLKLSWQYYDYVTKYILYVAVDGIEQTIETSDFEYFIDIPNKEVTQISAKVRAVFIDNTSTNLSDTISFNICNMSNNVTSTIYTHTDSNYDMYSTIYNKGLCDMYELYTLSTVSVEEYYNLYQKTIRDYIFVDYNLYENIWQTDVGDCFRFDTTITSSYDLIYNYNTTIYSKIDYDALINTIIKYPTSISYPMHMTIEKVTIACLGDSITAGHPNFWAETGTGEITSQYEYWLNRRLKDEFNVVNCGYGQEKTNDMLERFDRDVVSIQPRYVIILGGTNDYVNTYIVRYGWKHRNVCL